MARSPRLDFEALFGQAQTAVAKRLEPTRRRLENEELQLQQYVTGLLMRAAPGLHAALGEVLEKKELAKIGTPELVVPSMQVQLGYILSGKPVYFTTGIKANPEPNSTDEIAVVVAALGNSKPAKQAAEQSYGIFMMPSRSGRIVRRSSPLAQAVDGKPEDRVGTAFAWLAERAIEMRDPAALVAHRTELRARAG